MAANFLESGSKKSSSAAMVDDRLSCALPGLAMVQGGGIKRRSLPQSVQNLVLRFVTSPSPVTVKCWLCLQEGADELSCEVSKRTQLAFQVDGQLLLLAR